MGAAEGSIVNRTARSSKVSSIRSSLFQRNAQNANPGAAPVFTMQPEVDALQAPFQFDSVSHTMCEYGKENKKDWSRDIFAILHNAIRSELLDLISLLNCVKRLGMRTSIRDFDGMRNWFQVFSGIVLDYCDLETKYLQPWIEKAIVEGGNGDAATFFSTMPGRLAQIRDIVANASNSFADLCNAGQGGDPKLNKAQKAILILASLDALIFQLFDYMNGQEGALTVTVSKFYKSEKKERETIMRKILKFVMKKSRRGETMLVLLTRWFSDSKMQKQIRKELAAVCEVNYGSLQSHFEMNHAGFIHQQKVRAGMHG